MNFVEYEKLAQVTNGKYSAERDIQHAAYGIVTEVGELFDAYKRHLFYGTELDLVNLMEEIGDVYWYVAIMARALELDLAELDNIEIEKYLDTLNVTLKVEHSLSSLICQADTLFSIMATVSSPGELEEHLYRLVEELVCFATVHGLQPANCRKANIAKLQKRYPDKFSGEAAVNRDTALERRELEKHL